MNDPAEVVAVLSALPAGDRLSTHFLDDGAVARVVERDPTTAELEAGYKEGELVLVLSSPVVLKVVTGNRNQPVANANRFTVATDGQGNAVSAEGDFEGDPQRNFFQIHASAGGATDGHPGRVTLYLDAPDPAPASFIAVPRTGGFPQLSFNRIQGSVGSVVVGSRRFEGYEATYVDVADPHRFGDATFTYDLYLAYTSETVNTPFNVARGTVHVPAALAAVGGQGSAPVVPSGGWSLAQVNEDNRKAENLTLDTSQFSRNLSSGDTTVQAAMETLDAVAGGSGGGTHAVVVNTRAFTAANDGSLIAWWHSGTRWIRTTLTGTAGFIGTAFDAAAATLTLSPVGKMAEILRAFTGGMWNPVAPGPAATTPYVGNVPLAARPAGVPGSIVFAGPAVSDVTPAWPQTQGGQTWIPVRTILSDEHRMTRERIEVVTAEGMVRETVDLDAAAVQSQGRMAPYEWLMVPVTRIGAGEGYRLARLVPFELVRSRLDLVTGMLRDWLIGDADRVAANDRRVVVYDDANDGFALGNPERPSPVAALPEPMVTGRRYITTGPSRLQPVIRINPMGMGANILATATFKVGTEDWQLIRFGPGGPAGYRNQVVLRAPAGSSLGLTSGGPPPFLAVHYGGGEGNLGNVGTDARSMIVGGAPSYVAGTAYDLYLRHSVDPHENEPAAVDVPSGDWTATGPYAVQGTPGAQYDWATQGNTDPVPAGKVPHLAGQEVLRHAFRMPLTTTSASNRFSGPALLDATVDLNDSALDGAEIIVTLDVSIQSSGSSDDLSWESGEPNPTEQDKRFHFSTRVGVETLRRLADYVAKTAGAPTGFLELLELSGYRATTRQGRLFLGVVVEQDVNAAGTGAGALDRPGPFLYWTGAAGAVGAVVAGTVTSHLSRIAGGSASSFTGLPDTPSDYGTEDLPILGRNEAGTAVVWREAPLVGSTSGQGAELARITIPTGVHAAGSLIDADWTVSSEATADGWRATSDRLGNAQQRAERAHRRAAGRPERLRHPGPRGRGGRAQVRGAERALADLEEGTAGRANDGANYSLYYKLSCTIPGGTAGTRALNLEFQRQLTERHADAFRLYGAGRDAILAATEIILYKLIIGGSVPLLENPRFTGSPQAPNPPLPSD